MSTIKSSTTLTTAYSVEADTTGALVIQTGATPTTAVTISAAQVVTLANALPVDSGGTGLTSAGTAGNLLTSNGTTWVSQAASGATGDNTVIVSTSPGTWTKPATVKSIKVTVVGGGGAGTTGSGFTPLATGKSGTGGGAGGAAIIFYPAASLPGPQPYTVGAATATSSFGVAPITVVSATGGSNGSPAPTGNGGLGGVGTNGNINLRGGNGTGSTEMNATGFIGAGGAGGASIFGANGGGGGLSGNSPAGSGTPGGNYGGGGGGSRGSTGNAGTGSGGVVIIEEFY